MRRIGPFISKFVLKDPHSVLRGHLYLSTMCIPVPDWVGLATALNTCSPLEQLCGEGGGGYRGGIIWRWEEITKGGTSGEDGGRKDGEGRGVGRENERWKEGKEERREQGRGWKGQWEEKREGLERKGEEVLWAQVSMQRCTHSFQLRTMKPHHCGSACSLTSLQMPLMYIAPNRMLPDIDPYHYHVPEPINAICICYCVSYNLFGAMYQIVLACWAVKYN